MSDPINDGGPAFPIENPCHLENGELFKQFPGMSLRDWFAGRAMQGEISAEYDGWETSGPDRERFIAERAYKMADAMIAARGKEGA